MEEHAQLNYRIYLKLFKLNNLICIVIFTSVISVATLYSFVAPQLYESQCTFFLVQRQRYEDSGLPIKNKVLFGRDINNKDVVVKVLNDIAANNMLPLGTQNSEAIIKAILQRITIKTKDNDDIITVAFVDKNPQFTHVFINALMKRYELEIQRIEKENVSNSLFFLMRQLAAYKKMLNVIDANIIKFKSIHVDALATTEVELDTEIAATRKMIFDNAHKKSELLEKVEELRHRQSLHSKLTELTRQLEGLSSKYTENYPEVIYIQNEIKYTKEKEMNYNVQYKSSDESKEFVKIFNVIKSLDVDNDRLSKHLNLQHVLLKEYRPIKRKMEEFYSERNQLKQAYDQLVVRHGQLEVATRIGDYTANYAIRVIESANFPNKPLTPNRPRIILFGIVMGLVSSFLFIVVKNFFDDTIKCEYFLREFNIPIVAVIPIITTPMQTRTNNTRDKNLYIVTVTYILFILLIVVNELIGGSTTQSINLKVMLSKLKPFPD